VILISQLNEIYMDAMLDPADTVNRYPKVMRNDYTVGPNVTGDAQPLHLRRHSHLFEHRP
jgi:hypothetical protein